MTGDVVEGDNHRIAWVDGSVEASVWKRPDLDHERGAANAEQIERTLLAWLERVPRGLQLDLREAPEAAGPKTLASLARWFGAYRVAGVKVCVIVGGSALQRMQYGRVIAESAGALGRLVEDEAQADAFLGRG